jgi:hypothetical protein
MGDGVGARLARAIADKDVDGLLELLDPELDFRGLTPKRFWEATSAKAFVDEVLLGAWFDASDHIDALEDVQLGSVGGRDRVLYLLRVTNQDGTFLVEQQAYFDVADERITWLRVMCSGYRRVTPAAG